MTDMTNLRRVEGSAGSYHPPYVRTGLRLTADLHLDPADDGVVFVDHGRVLVQTRNHIIDPAGFRVFGRLSHRLPL